MREKYPDLELEYVFTDSGCELPETYEYLDRIEAVLGIKIVRIKPQKDFDYWIKIYKGVLPSPDNRWCTRELKLKPYKDYVKQDSVYSYIAIRADENRKGFISSKDNIKPVYPFIEDGITLHDVIEILSKSGLGLPDYYTWRKRSGCYFCFYQTLEEWKGLKLHHPDKFEKACSYEENHSDGRIYTWCGKRGGKPLFLRDIDKINISSSNDHCRENNRLIDTLDRVLKIRDKMWFELEGGLNG